MLTRFAKVEHYRFSLSLPATLNQTSCRSLALFPVRQQRPGYGDVHFVSQLFRVRYLFPVCQRGHFRTPVNGTNGFKSHFPWKFAGRNLIDLA
jgi:hypothetical protein